MKSVTSSSVVVNEPNIIPTVEFILRFTPQERVAIRASNNEYVIDLMKLLDDPRLSSVNLTSLRLREGVYNLVSLQLITDARATEILRID